MSFTVSYESGGRSRLRHQRGRVRLDVTTATYVGNREHNQDAVLADPENGVFAVADGIGGHAGGGVASTVTVDLLETFLRDYELEELADDLQDFVEKTNARLYDLGRGTRLSEMGTTLTLLAIRDGEGATVHVGDSRCYRLRTDLEVLTTDHTDTRLLTRALGDPGRERGDVRRIDVQPGDIYMLCSDGLWDVVSHEKIAALLRGAYPAGALVNEAATAGAKDNVSVIVVTVLEEAEGKDWRTFALQAIASDPGRYGVVSEDLSTWSTASEVLNDAAAALRDARRERREQAARTRDEARQRRRQVQGRLQQAKRAKRGADDKVREAARAAARSTPEDAREANAALVRATEEAQAAAAVVKAAEDERERQVEQQTPAASHDADGMRREVDALRALHEAQRGLLRAREKAWTRIRQAHAGAAAVLDLLTEALASASREAAQADGRLAVADDRAGAAEERAEAAEQRASAHEMRADAAEGRASAAEERAEAAERRVSAAEERESQR